MVSNFVTNFGIIIDICKDFVRKLLLVFHSRLQILFPDFTRTNLRAAKRENKFILPNLQAAKRT